MTTEDQVLAAMGKAYLTPLPSGELHATMTALDAVVQAIHQLSDEETKRVLLMALLAVDKEGLLIATPSKVLRTPVAGQP